jgi:hypothetical protein
MTTRPKRCIRSAGVTFEVPVLEYLHELARAQSRDRSFCINQIIREHATRNGRSLPSAFRSPDEPEPSVEG